MISSVDVVEICAQLLRDSGGKKVMLCAADGEVLAHAGATGAIDERVGEALAQLIAVVVDGATSGRLPATKDLVASVPAGLPGGLSACATSVADKAALVILFDTTATTAERVRLKIRRAREVLLKSLSVEPTASKPEPS